MTDHKQRLDSDTAAVVCDEPSSDPAALRREKQQERIEGNLRRIRHKLLVLSGKGGVGKSSVAAGLAWELARRNRKCGLLDADLHGPTVPRLLGLTGGQVTEDNGSVHPVELNANLSVMSMGFLLPSMDSPVIWRGPLKYQMIKQFLADVEWGELDYLVVDLPPGTGDEAISAGQLIDAAGAVIVTTPQVVATDNVRKSVNFARKLGLPIIGVIENMSGFVCPKCGERTLLFGVGGGKLMAGEMGVPFLGSIPIDPLMARSGDEGCLGVYLEGDSPGAEAFAAITDRIAGATGDDLMSSGDIASTRRHARRGGGAGFRGSPSR